MTLMQHIQQLGRRTLDFLLPPSCPVCHGRIAEIGHFCASCWADLEQISDPKCQSCGIPFLLEDDGPQCGVCLSDPQPYRRAFAPVVYSGVGRSAVLALKHGRRFMAAPAMAHLMWGAVPDFEVYDCIMPVPLHWTRRIARRFNQSQLLAGAIAKKAGVPVESASLLRSRATPTQGPLKRKARFKNVSVAFNVKPETGLRGKTILLVDDVLTTGATAGACTQALLDAGVQAVDVAVFARVATPIDH